MRDAKPGYAHFMRAAGNFTPAPFLLRPVLRRSITSLAVRHPALFDRLGVHAGKTYLIDPTDMPIVLRLAPRRIAPRLEPFRRTAAPKCDATIAGPLVKLLALIQARDDGDALFFSRDLVFEGDTEAVVALRNAIDNAELDLVEEFEALFGLLQYPLRHARRRLTDALHVVERTSAKFGTPA